MSIDPNDPNYPEPPDDDGGTLCDFCGVTDTAAKIHVQDDWRKDDRTTIAVPSFHFYDIPGQYTDLLGAEPQHGNTIEALAYSRSPGAHDAGLHALIASQRHVPDPEPVGPHTGSDAE